MIAAIVVKIEEKTIMSAYIAYAICMAFYHMFNVVYIHFG